MIVFISAVNPLSQLHIRTQASTHLCISGQSTTYHQLIHRQILLVYKILLKAPTLFNKTLLRAGKFDIHVYNSKKILKVQNQLRVFLCINRFQTPADSKRINRKANFFRGYFLHDHLRFLWKAIRSNWSNFTCSKTTVLIKKKYKTL